MHAKDVGRAGESLAREYLVSIGYEILGFNLRLGRGEIDILARDEDALVVVEVKTRRSCSFGRPEEQLPASKIRTLRGLAARVAWAHPGATVRVDIIAVTVGRECGDSISSADILHLRGVDV